MKAYRRLYLAASVIILGAILLPQGATISATGALAGSTILFTEHTIDGDFNGVRSVYATDVDGDGDVDVLGAASNADDITWWENDGSENFAEHTIDGGFNGAYSVHATDVDGDGDVDVLGAANFADDITWWENDGSESFTRHTIDGDFDYACSVYGTDVDGDGDVDVVGAANNADDITWWENDGSENFTGHTIDGDFNGAWSVYATDVDGDGHVDILGVADEADDITWWENDGSENFTGHTIAGNFDGARSVYATDVDGDGDVDVLGAAGYADDITWWENDGSENFTEHIIDGDFDYASSVYATDVDGDGDVDVLGAAWMADDITWWEQEVAPPEAPTNLDATAVSKTQIDLGWQDNSADESAFHIERSPDGSTGWTEIGTVGANETSYSDTGLDCGTTYHYRVRAYRDSDGQYSGYSDVDDSTTQACGSPDCYIYLPLVMGSAGPPSSPPVLDDISNPDGDGNYTVSWSAVSGATSYTLEEDDNADFSSPTTVYSGSGTSESITGKDLGTYYYRVKASNASGSTDWSNTESVVVDVEPTGPEAGHYTGTPSVSFDVTGDQQVCNFDITVPFSSSSCRIRPPDCAEIVDSGFTFTETHEAFGVVMRIEGTFDSRTHASGDYSVSLCGNQLISPPSQGTWEASK